YVKLERADEDWAPTPVCISVNGTTPAACGSLLMDTGVTAMYLTVPATQAPDAIRTSSGPSPTLVDGTRIAISVPTEASAQALYAFTLGQGGNPLAPAGLHLVSLVRGRRSSIPACTSSTVSIISTMPTAGSSAFAGPAMPRRPSARSCLRPRLRRI